MKICFGDGAPIVDESHAVGKAHGRLTSRTCRTSQILHGYSRFPGLHQAVEVASRAEHLRRGEVVKETTTVACAATDFSPREAGAEVLDALLRRHWMAENRHRYVRDNHRREDRGTWRTGRAAFVMFVLLAVSLNLPRAASPLWRDETPMTLRSTAADHTITAAPGTVLQKPP